MNEIWTTVCGNVTNEPTHRQTDDGLAIVKFRIASTPYTYQKGQGWIDGATSYLTVTCFRALAENAGGSIAKGDPVFAYGKLQVTEYQTKEGRTVRDTEIVASTVGHDLSKGTSAFRRTGRGAAAPAFAEPSAQECPPGERNDLPAELVPAAGLGASMIQEPDDIAAAGLAADFGHALSSVGDDARADAA